MTFDATGTAEALFAARVLFALALGYLALGNLRSLSETVAYAASKGAPAPRLMVPFTSLALLAGAGAILAGAYPALGALAVVGFLVGVLFELYFLGLDPAGASERPIVPEESQ